VTVPQNKQTQIVLDASRVRAHMGDRTPKEIETLSRKRVTGQVVRRAMNSESITISLAMHLAETLGVELDALRRTP
jgi:hypothetical protein